MKKILTLVALTALGSCATPHRTISPALAATLARQDRDTTRTFPIQSDSAKNARQAAFFGK